LRHQQHVCLQNLLMLLPPVVCNQQGTCHNRRLW
jgi:hypothetical protein